MTILLLFDTPTQPYTIHTLSHQSLLCIIISSSPTGLRDCVKWMQGAEQEQGYFYDLVVRLRDDTFAFADWIFDSTEMKNALTR